MIISPLLYVNDVTHISLRVANVSWYEIGGSNATKSPMQSDHKQIGLSHENVDKRHVRLLYLLRFRTAIMILPWILSPAMVAACGGESDIRQ